MAGGPPPPSTYVEAVKMTDALKEQLPKPEITTYKGEIAIKFPQQLIDHLEKPFKYALVGKFSQGRPQMEAIRRFMSIQNFEAWVCYGGTLQLSFYRPGWWF